MIKQKTIRLILIICFLFFISCNTANKSLELERSFKTFLLLQGIKNENVNDSIYSLYYSDFLQNETKKSLLKNPNLKTNKVYLHQDSSSGIITFIVYSDNGKLYLAGNLKTDTQYLSEPVNGVAKIANTFPLNFYGFFEVEDTIIKNTRYEKTRFKEWYHCNVGIIKKDTITLIKTYRANKFGSYKKKWLTKTIKTNDDLLYQPELIAKKTKNMSGRDIYIIEGSFKVEKNIQEEKILELMDKVKY